MLPSSPIAALPPLARVRAGTSMPPPQVTTPLPVATLPAVDPLRSRIVAIAAGELGVHEDTGANDGERIVDYRRAVSGPGEDPLRNESWCADFVSWTYREAGAPIGFGGNGEDWTVALRLWAMDQHRYRQAPTFSTLPPGTPPTVPVPPTRLVAQLDAPRSPLPVQLPPAPGDVVFFDWDRDGTVQHVGIVESVADGALATIEGNTSDMVARRTYALDDPRIVGWMRAD